MLSSRRLLVSLVAALGAAVAVAVPAQAHSALTGVDPVEGSVLTVGQVVTLSFNEDLLEIGTELAVTDAAGVTSAVEYARPVASQVAITIPALADGPMTLAWRVVSADGHPIEGVLAYEFDAPAATSTPSPSASASPEPSEQASAVASESPQASVIATSAQPEVPAESGGNALGLVLGGALAVLAVVALAVVLTKASRKSGQTSSQK